MRGTKIVFSRSPTAESTVEDARKNIMCALDLSLEMQRAFTGALTLVFEQEGAYKGPYSDVRSQLKWLLVNLMVLLLIVP